jgi:hypothetical protein
MLFSIFLVEIERGFGFAASEAAMWAHDPRALCAEQAHRFHCTRGDGVFSVDGLKGSPIP